MCQLQIKRLADEQGNVEGILRTSGTLNSPPPDDEPGNKWGNKSPAQPREFVKEWDQAKKVKRPRIDPKLTSIVQFPGQGAQFVGMGKKLLQYPNVPEIYDVAGEILGYNLLNMCLNGPIADLSKTVFCQTAIFVTSVAALEKLKAEHPGVRFTPRLSHTLLWTILRLIDWLIVVFSMRWTDRLIDWILFKMILFIHIILLDFRLIWRVWFQFN